MQRRNFIGKAIATGLGLFCFGKVMAKGPRTVDQGLPRGSASSKGAGPEAPDADLNSYLDQQHLLNVRQAQHDLLLYGECYVPLNWEVKPVAKKLHERLLTNLPKSRDLDYFWRKHL